MKRRKIRKTRIYYGPHGHEKSMSLQCRVRDATEDVKVNGKVMHALKGQPGVTVGCALSNVASANPDSFPHPVYLAAFTKSTALIVEKLVPNGLSHAVRYGHGYGHITDKNDEGTLKKMVKEDPAIIEKPFVLRVPRIRPGDHSRIRTETDKPRGSNRTYVPRGGYARARKAGLIPDAVAKQLSAGLRRQKAAAKSASKIAE